MSLVVGISKPKQISKWCEYKDDKGNVLAEFKIRGIAYKPYQVALERANNQVSSKGFNVDTAKKDDKLLHELLFDATAVHLIEEWKGVSFAEKVGEEIIETEVAFTTDNAKKLLSMGDIGVVIWDFVKTNAEKIQAEADAIKLEVLGKSESSTSGLDTEMIEQQAEA